jgi:DNA-binding MarR family transcriptional regulator
MPGHDRVLPDSSPASPAVTALSDLLNAAERFSSAVSRKYQLGPAEDLAMRSLASSGSMTAGALATATRLNSSSVTSLIDRLERLEFVRRRAHPDDRRRVVVEITETGHDALRWVRSRLVTGYEQIAADELPNVISNLRKIAESLDRRASEVFEQLGGPS